MNEQKMTEEKVKKASYKNGESIRYITYDNESTSAMVYISLTDVVANLSFGEDEIEVSDFIKRRLVSHLVMDKDLQSSMLLNVENQLSDSTIFVDLRMTIEILREIGHVTDNDFDFLKGIMNLQGLLFKLQKHEDYNYLEKLKKTITELELENKKVYEINEGFKDKPEMTETQDDQLVGRRSKNYPILFATSQIAAKYNMTAYKLNNILEEEGIQYKVNKKWILKYPYNNDMIAVMKRMKLDSDEIVLHLYWTTKGVEFIDQILDKREMDHKEKIMEEQKKDVQEVLNYEAPKKQWTQLSLFD